MHYLTGFLLGTVYGEVQLSTVSATLLFYTLGLSMTIGLASLRVFGNERVVFWREVSPGSGMGLSPLPYFLGKCLVELPRIGVLTFTFCMAFYPLVGTLCNFWSFVAYSCMFAWHVSGWSILISIAFDDKSAQLLLIIFCLVALLYAGVQTRLSEMSTFEYNLSWLSPNRWLIEDLFVCHAQSLSATYRLPPQWCKFSESRLLLLRSCDRSTLPCMLALLSC